MAGKKRQPLEAPTLQRRALLCTNRHCTARNARQFGLATGQGASNQGFAPFFVGSVENPYIG